MPKCTMEVGVWLHFHKAGDAAEKPEIPDGRYACVIEAPGGTYLTVDPSGNVRGDPCAVERELLALRPDADLTILGGLGLARLAIRSRKGP